MHFSPILVVAALPFLTAAMPSGTGQNMKGVQGPAAPGNPNPPHGGGNTHISGSTETFQDNNHLPFQKNDKNEFAANVDKNFQKNQGVNQGAGSTSQHHIIKGDGIHGGAGSSDPNPHLTVEERPVDKPVNSKASQKQSTTAHVPVKQDGSGNVLPSQDTNQQATRTKTGKPHKAGSQLDKRALYARNAFARADGKLLAARDAYATAYEHALNARDAYLEARSQPEQHVYARSFDY